MTLPDLLDLAQAAERLRCKPEWLRRATVRGDVPGRKIGRDWRYTEDDLSAYLEKVRRGADAWALSPQQQAALNRRRSA